VSPSGCEVLEAARIDANMSFGELWMAYFALGGSAQPTALRAYLGGTATGLIDYDIVAQAINETYVGRGANHPVPYREDLV
jgi:hypothetical protein